MPSTTRTTTCWPHAIAAALVIAIVPLASARSAPAVNRAIETSTIYTANGGMITLVSGNGDPIPAPRLPEVLRFSDDQGVPVRVFAQRKVDIGEARAALSKSRSARARADEVHRRLALGNR